jgi:hypothetical protein
LRREARRVRLSLPRGCVRLLAVPSEGLSAAALRRDRLHAEELSICSERPRAIGVTALAIDGEGDLSIRMVRVSSE